MTPPFPRSVCSCRRSVPLVAAWLALLLIFGAADARGQRFFTRTYTELDGLPSADVSDLDQHPDGELWLTTAQGPCRFDGLLFRPVKTPLDFPSPPRQLAIDGEGAVWFSGAHLIHGVQVWLDDHWTLLPSPPGLPESALVLDLLTGPDNGTLVVTHEQGLWRVRADGVWNQMGDAGSCDARVWAADLSPGGPLVARDDGLARWTDGLWATDLASAAGLPSGPIYGVCFDPPGRIWLAGDDWLGLIEAARGRVLLADQALGLRAQSERFRRGPELLPDLAGGVWLATQSSLLHYDAQTDTSRSMGSETGLAASGAAALLRDRDQNVWFASPRGLSRIPSLRFSNRDHRDGLLSDEVSALLEDSRGRLIIGHNDGLSLLQDDQTRVLLPAQPGLAHADDTRVLEIAEDRDGTLWLARAWGGLQSLSPEGRLRRHPLPTEGPVHVTSVTTDAKGQLWIGSSEGLWRDQGQGPQRVPGPPSFAGHPFVRRVIPYRDELWLGSASAGVALLAEGRWTSFRDPAGGAADNVFAIQPRPDGHVFVGTQAGLREVRDSALGLPASDSLRIGQPVYSILSDDSGCTWFGTRQGLVCWDGNRTRVLGVRQGLAGQEVNRCAALKDSQGRIWFGTVDGLSCYRSEYDRLPPSAPSLRLLGADVRGQHRPFGAGLRLEHEEGLDLGFGFRAISFLDDGRVWYQAWLEGFDHDWLPESTCAGGRVRYTGLPAGEYRLHVRARAERGPWSGELVSPPVIVSLPWWRQAWFMLLAALILLGAGFVLMRQLVKRRYTARLERLVAERTRELASAELRYRQMFDKNEHAQLLLEPEGLCVGRANHAAEELWGLPAGSLTGLPLSELLLETDQDALGDLGRLDVGGQHGFPTALRDRAGVRHDLELDVCCYELLDQRTLHVTARDVTEHKQLERRLQQAQKLESIGRLAGGVAHDFSNLLTAVMGQVEQARQEVHDPEAVTLQLDQLDEAARRGARLTSQLLAFAREQPSSPQVIDVPDSLTRLVPFLRQLMREDIRFELDAHPDAGRVRIDSVEFDQVMLNLVVNASDAMPHGGLLSLEVRAEQEDTAQAPLGWVTTRVTDHGTGMDPELVARVREPFFTTKPMGEGTGLGLATCHGIVGKAGGQLEIESQLGQGTRVNVRLPRVADPVSTVITHTPPEELAETSGHITILLVEDEKMVREVAVASLERLGYRVVAAEDGPGALRFSQAHEGAIDLLLTDVIMPGMDGRQLAATLLRQRPDMAVLYTSGYTAESLPDQESRPGEGQLLRKPYRLADLSSAVSRTLGKRRTSTS